jgi:hypothetical protein
LLAIALTTIALMPLFYLFFVKEEREEVLRVHTSAATFLGRNFELIKVFAWLFVGIALAYAFWFVFLPEKESIACLNNENLCFNIPTKSAVFKDQRQTLQGIQQLRDTLTGKAIIEQGICGKEFFCWFRVIFSNNLSVLFLAVLFSFIYSAGAAIFLLGWNASVVGVSIGQSFLQAEFFRFLGLLPHGIPELMGYFLGAISGGLISVALSKRKYYTHEFERIAMDSFILLLLAGFSLLIGGVIEAYILIGQEGLAFVYAVAYVLFLAVIVLAGEKGKHSARLP